MKHFIRTFVLALASGLFISQIAQAESQGQNVGEGQTQWSEAVKNTIAFFNRTAWDEESGTYASEIDGAGRLTSDNRDIVCPEPNDIRNFQSPRRRSRSQTRETKRQFYYGQHDGSRFPGDLL